MSRDCAAPVDEALVRVLLREALLLDRSCLGHHELRLGMGAEDGPDDAVHANVVDRLLEDGLEESSPVACGRRWRARRPSSHRSRPAAGMQWVGGGCASGGAGAEDPFEAFSAWRALLVSRLVRPHPFPGGEHERQHEREVLRPVGGSSCSRPPPPPPLRLLAADDYEPRLVAASFLGERVSSRCEGGCGWAGPPAGLAVGQRWEAREAACGWMGTLDLAKNKWDLSRVELVS